MSIAKLNIIQNICLSRLGGFIGSSPEVLCSHPLIELDENTEKEFISKVIPEGIEPNCFSLDKLKNNEMLLSYSFSIKSSENDKIRSDLAAISIIIDNNRIDINDLKILLKHLIDKIVEGKITTSMLMTSLEIIYNGINNRDQIQIGNLNIDISELIREKKLSFLKKKPKQDLRGGRIF